MTSQFDIDLLLTSPAEQLARLRDALARHPEHGALRLRAPLLGTRLPWALLWCEERKPDPWALLVAGEHAGNAWNTEAPYTALAIGPDGAPILFPVDPGDGAPRPDISIMSGDWSEEERPTGVALIAEIATAASHWGRDQDLRAAWHSRALREGLPHVPDCYLEVRWGRDVIRGLVIAPGSEHQGRFEDGHPVTLQCADGRIIDCDLTTAGAYTVLHGDDTVLDHG